MTSRLSLLSLVSVATLALALAQPAHAEGEPAASATAAAAPATEAPAAAPAASPTAEPMSHPAASDAAMDQRRAEMDAERNRRYAELRTRAAEMGVDLPETPPWEQSAMARPEMPRMPGMTPDERRAQMERMRNMTPEERAAARAENYKQLRERAAAQGIQLPETPPWEQAQQRRKAMQEKWEAYRKEVEAMTDAQREAARAIFGGAPGPDVQQMPMQPGRPMDMPMDMRPNRPMDMPMGMPMDRSMDMPMGGPMDMSGPGQGYRGLGPCPHPDCGGMMPPRGMMPDWDGDQGGHQGMPQPQGGYGAPWGRGY